MTKFEQVVKKGLSRKLLKSLEQFESDSKVRKKTPVSRPVPARNRNLDTMNASQEYIQWNP